MGAAGFWQALVQSRQDGSALTAAAAASMLPAENVITLPNNYWRVGRQWRVTATGRVSTVITTPGTLRFDLRLGAVVAWDSLAIALDTSVARTNMPWYLEVLLTCRTIGSGVASNLIGTGKLTYEGIAGAPATPPKGSLTAMLPWNTAPAVGTSFNNALANTVDMFFTQTVATGSMTCHQFLIEELDASF